MYELQVEKEGPNGIGDANLSNQKVFSTDGATVPLAQTGVSTVGITPEFPFDAPNLSNQKVFFTDQPTVGLQIDSETEVVRSLVQKSISTGQFAVKLPFASETASESGVEKFPAEKFALSVELPVDVLCGSEKVTESFSSVVPRLGASGPICEKSVDLNRTSPAGFHFDGQKFGGRKGEGTCRVQMISGSHLDPPLVPRVVKFLA